MIIDNSIVIAVMGLIGVLLGSVLTRRTKRLELVYAKKAEAYQNYLEKAGTLAHSTNTGEHYEDYLRALLSARLVASPIVEDALMDQQGINWALQELRCGSETDYGGRESARSERIHPAMERVIKAMNKDLLRLL
ncbi:MAG TPA: hypothetical protein VGZ22_01000 [Isosphaeraceae bacterium]|jgi:hypothetical protein|nr:hypothetical protein [Isosphaeraceae bacterium]